ncbi:thermonuclease family protein [Candidatus Bandiella euplotis]|uniref:Thermonuclease family C-terminal domain protein n=1 Tax=Candidatus Bandiella euplotis TaxID=1664265 RepID=A0ABZ0UNI0_9RICK|nr:thermonuclease family protein [Candidatus Bandiella woodruffii]WPX96887.1 Thermonuclease family C-terminal domain protein [Candidatus Bandiella woodruffii]WPX97267.1 Thermonuclease family C-terminal domain protein [Candidatus Bandiella woodruffii]
MTTLSRVVDGDTIVLNNEKIRLKGIDAPESKQWCWYIGDHKEKISYKCGVESAKYLSKLIEGGERIECTNEGKDLYGRTLSYCYVGITNINRDMVYKGWAVGYGEFKVEELIAMYNKAGIWRGDFEMPSEWRKKRKKRRR